MGLEGRVGDRVGNMSGDSRPDPATEAFLAHRNLLFTVAYEMLGTAADAEDVLAGSSRPQSPRTHPPFAHPSGTFTRRWGRGDR
jgi:hypothetical protein